MVSSPIFDGSSVRSRSKPSAAPVEASLSNSYRQPQGGRYGEHFRRRAGESVAPAAFPDRVLHVA